MVCFLSNLMLIYKLAGNIDYFCEVLCPSGSGVATAIRNMNWMKIWPVKKFYA